MENGVKMEKLYQRKTLNTENPIKIWIRNEQRERAKIEMKQRKKQVLQFFQIQIATPENQKYLWVGVLWWLFYC